MVFVLSLIAATQIVPSEQQRVTAPLKSLAAVAELSILSFIVAKAVRGIRRFRVASAEQQDADAFNAIRGAARQVIDSERVADIFSYEIAIMYLGRIVEYGSVDRVLNQPRHPYTQALLSSVPHIDPTSGREVIRLQGDIPSPSNPPNGCHFYPRCPRAIDDCCFHGITPWMEKLTVEKKALGSGAWIMSSYACRQWAKSDTG